ncbi:MAG: tetratricopeptide repeat protein [Bacteroidetes bacterium]|nr:tetratricopeptide repeat protein [Bacteroidota bacterium]
MKRAPLLRSTLIALMMFMGWTVPSSAQWIILQHDADSAMQKGIDYIYNVRFDSAHACFEYVKKLYPEHPAGYFMDAMVEWWKINLNRNVYSNDEWFLQKIEKVLEVCDRSLEADPKNLMGLFFKGGALGFRGRFYATRESMIKAANDGKDALDLLEECQRIAPNNHDIMLGTGLYNYFAIALPEKYPVLSPIMTFFRSGDKALGILQLQAAARQARYARVEAQVVLLQVYYEWEKDYQKAVVIARELNKKYPNNPYFHSFFGRVLVVTGPLDTMEILWRDVLNRCIAKQYGYVTNTAREALYYIGMALMMKQDLPMALKYFYKADEASRVLDQDPSGFMIKTNLKIGQIYDLQGKRELAIKQYDKVLGWSDYGGSHADAERFKATPYR